MQNNKLTHAAILPYLILLISTFCVLAETPSWAEAEKSTYHTAKSLLHQNKTHEAYDLLWQALMENPRDTKINLLFGSVAIKLKLYESASAAYNRVLMVNPNHTLARFKLSITYYKLGDYSLAEEELKKVIESKSPQEIKTSAQRYLQAIKKKKHRHKMRLTVGVGRQYNTNVNTAPGDDYIDTIDDSKRLKSDSMELADWGTIVDVKAKHLWDFGLTGSFLWENSLNFYNILYDRESDYNINSLKLATGLKHKKATEYTVYAPLTIDVLDYSSGSCTQVYGMAPRVDWHHSENLMTRWSTICQYQVYPDNSKKDGVYSFVGIMPRIYWGEKKYRFQWRLGYEWKWAKEDIKAYDGPVTTMSFYVRFNKWFQSLIMFDYRDRQYDDRQHEYNKTRENKRYKTKVKFFARLPWQRTRAVLSFDYTHNDSNIEAYDYNRAKTTLMLEKRF